MMEHMLNHGITLGFSAKTGCFVNKSAFIETNMVPRISDPSYTARADTSNALSTVVYRGTYLIRKRLPLGPCRRPMHRALWWS